MDAASAECYLGITYICMYYILLFVLYVRYMMGKFSRGFFFLQQFREGRGIQDAQTEIITFTVFEFNNDARHFKSLKPLRTENIIEIVCELVLNSKIILNIYQV